MKMESLNVLVTGGARGIGAGIVEELAKKGVEQLTKAAGKGELSVKFDATQNFDIGDIIEAKDIVTGISVKETVSKKIVSIQSEEIKVSYNIKEV